jgi:cell division protein FtsQ
MVEVKTTVSKTVDAAEKRLRTRAMLKRALKIVLCVNIALGLLLIVSLFFRAPYFSLQSLDLIGNHRLTRAEVIESAGIKGGMNLLTADLKSITTNLKQHPWIRSASVYRRFPGRLVIEIQEKIPTAILTVDKLYYVDERGEIFTQVRPGNRVNYPLLTGISQSQLESNRPAVQKMIKEGLSLLDIIDRQVSDITPSMIAEVRIDLTEGLALQTNSGRILILGNGNYQLKLARYSKLKRFLTSQGQWANAAIIDLDFEDRAVVRWGGHRVQG